MKIPETKVSEWFPTGLFIFAHSWIVTTSIKAVGKPLKRPKTPKESTLQAFWPLSRRKTRSPNKNAISRGKFQNSFSGKRVGLLDFQMKCRKPFFLFKTIWEKWSLFGTARTLSQLGLLMHVSACINQTSYWLFYDFQGGFFNFFLMRVVFRERKACFLTPRRHRKTKSQGRL